MKFKIASSLLAGSLFSFASLSMGSDETAAKAPVLPAGESSTTVSASQQNVEKSWLHVLEEKRRAERAIQLEKEKELSPTKTAATEPKEDSAGAPQLKDAGMNQKSDLAPPTLKDKTPSIELKESFK